MVFSGFILSKIPYERAFPHTSPYFPNRDISRTTWLGEEPEGGGGCSGCYQAGVLIMGRMTEMKVSRENLCKNLAMVRARAVFPTKCMLFKYSCISVSPPSIHNQPPKTAHPKHHHPDPLPTRCTLSTMQFKRASKSKKNIPEASSGAQEVRRARQKVIKKHHRPNPASVSTPPPLTIAITNSSRLYYPSPTTTPSDKPTPTTLRKRPQRGRARPLTPARPRTQTTAELVDFEAEPAAVTATLIEAATATATATATAAAATPGEHISETHSKRWVNDMGVICEAVFEDSSLNAGSNAAGN